jgi:hypothetical protein
LAIQTRPTWFAMLLHNSTVCALTGVKATFTDLASTMLTSIAARRGKALTDHQLTDLLDGFANVRPYPDVPPALERLRAAGYRSTVAFTNSSLDLVTSHLSTAALSSGGSIGPWKELAALSRNFALISAMPASFSASSSAISIGPQVA